MKISHLLAIIMVLWVVFGTLIHFQTKEAYSIQTVNFGKFVYTESQIRALDDYDKKYIKILNIDIDKVSVSSKCADGYTYYITVERKLNTEKDK